MINFVHVRTAEGQQFMARVLHEEGDEMVLAAPDDDGVGWLARPGKAVDVGWMTRQGMVWCSGTVCESPLGDEPVVAVRLLDSPVAVDRRAHRRVPVEFDVDVYRAGVPEPVSGTCSDVGGGGLQASVPLELAAGEVVRLVIHPTEGDPLRVTAHVARRTSESRFGFVFELVLEGSRERLVRRAFGRAARARAARPG